MIRFDFKRILPKFSGLTWAGLLVAGSLGVSSSEAGVVTGRVVDRLGAPVAGATLVVQGTWEAVETSPRGVFTVEIPKGGSRVRFTAPTGETIALEVADDRVEPLEVILPITVGEVVEMETYVVLPSQFPVGDMPGAQMKSIDAVLTPGSLADFNRALQTLPGVDAVDEGDALYVRGGDAFETGVFINGSKYQQIRDEETPLGTFVGSVSPFLADQIRFEAGGFGASRGNLLSAIVEVETLGAPESKGASVNVGLGALSAGVDLPFTRRTGVRLTATRRDVNPILRVNGSDRAFLRAPHGRDLSVLFETDHRWNGTAKLFGIEQTNTMALWIAQPEGRGLYRNSNERRQGWATWRQDVGVWQLRADASWARLDKTESLNLWAWQDRTSEGQASLRVDRRLAEKANVAAGWEGQETLARFDESYGVEAWRDRVRSVRTAAWSEADWMVTDKVRAVTGVRFDSSNLGGGTTFDPRLAVGYKLTRDLDLSAAWGVYHQRPEPLAMSRLRVGAARASAQATHAIVSLAWRHEDWQARLEVFQKEYDRLALINTGRRAFAGEGTARGVELSGRFPLPWQWQGRTSLSLSDADRSDLRTEQLAPYGVAYSGAVVVQRSFDNGVQLGLTWRQAAGKRITAVDSARWLPEEGRWEPQYGEANRTELRPLQRLDLLLTRIRDLNTKTQMVTYLSISNLLGRSNHYDLAYSEDFTVRQPVPSLLGRVIYVGVVFNFR